MAWEEKIVALERQMMVLQSTVTKYETWFRDQKLFCDCVAKYLKREYGFDIWLQLDMLRSTLGFDSSDSEEGFFSSISVPRKRNAKSDHRQKISRLRRTYDAPRARCEITSTATSSPLQQTRHSSGFESRRSHTDSIESGPLALRALRQNASSVMQSYNARSERKSESPSAVQTPRRNEQNSTVLVAAHSERSPEVSEIGTDRGRHDPQKSGGLSPSRESRPSSAYHNNSNQHDTDGDLDARVIKTEEHEDYSEEIIELEVEPRAFNSHMAPPEGNYGAQGGHSQRQKKGPHKRHAVWGYYEINGNTAKCLVPGCDTEVRGIYPTNVLNHMKRHHVHVYNKVMHEEWLKKQAAVQQRFDFGEIQNSSESVGFDDPLA